MEFHMAHEKVIQGRNKYLIPILLRNVDAKNIKDADLRMYLESHTYLDSKDRVRCIIYLTLLHSNTVTVRM